MAPVSFTEEAMKVYIGPYDHWFRPYTWLKRAVQRWYGVYNARNEEEYDKQEQIDSWVFKRFYYLNRLENWINHCRPRKVKIRIDAYDTWGMDDTLALVVLPMLKQLKETKHGSPHVEDEDVPDELKSVNAAPMTAEQQNMGYPDDNTHKRWDWVMNEMIWAFEQMVDPNAEDKFHYDLDPAKPRTELGLSFQDAMRRGGYDRDGHMEWQSRKSRGLLLFGKYFEGLWD
jgi:hypothetical protein